MAASVQAIRIFASRRAAKLLAPILPMISDVGACGDRDGVLGNATDSALHHASK